MSATRNYINEQTLQTMQLEILSLKAVIENDQANKLKTLSASDSNTVTWQQMKFQKNNIELEYHARIKFLDKCKSAFEYIHSTHKRKLTSTIFRQFQLPEEFLADDMDLLIGTIRLTNQLISKPDQSAETLTLLAHHLLKVNTHLQAEQKATKKKNIWLGVVCGLFALMSLACAVSIMVFMPAGFAIGGVLALCGLFSVFTFSAVLVPLLSAPSLTPRKPAGSIAALCDSAISEAMAKTKNTP